LNSGYTRGELKVVRQAKVSGSKEACEQLLDRSIPDDIWSALTKKKIDELLRWEPAKDAIFFPFKNKRK